MCILQESVDRDLLHPLVELTSSWLNCRDQPVLNPTVQPVLLNDSVYAEGWSNKLPIIWKYSIPKHTWSPLPYPEGILSDRVAITAYQSRLLVVAGDYRISNYGKQVDKLGDKVFVLKSDGSWEEDVISPLPDGLSMLNISASSEGSCLIVAWKEDYHIKLLIYDGHTWIKREGPKLGGIDRRINILFCDQTVFLTVSQEYPILHKTSLEELLAADSTDTSRQKWVDIQNIPRDHSNLTLFCGHFTLVFRLTSSAVCVLVYLTASNTWMELGALNCDSQIMPNIVGLSDGRLLLIGRARIPGANLIAQRFPLRRNRLFSFPPEQIPHTKIDVLVVTTKGK